MKSIFQLLGLTALTGINGAVCTTEAKQFEDKFGRVMVAELVSHTGAEADTGKDRKVRARKWMSRVDVFSEKDQQFIRDWMKKHPSNTGLCLQDSGSEEKTVGSQRPSQLLFKWQDDNLCLRGNGNQPDPARLSSDLRIELSCRVRGIDQKSSSSSVAMKRCKGTPCVTMTQITRFITAVPRRLPEFQWA